MKNMKPLHHGYRFPPQIISHAVWTYHRFFLSFRDVEDVLADRGITVSYEFIRSAAATYSRQATVAEIQAIIETALSEGR